ncbi:MAG: hypothetical protein H0V20_09560 [Actinobacteria bacterium]|nr:hypothetical protein [Actinomycetota bacterium]
MFGAPVRLTGLARGVGTAYLERKPYGGSWARMREVAPALGGAWSTNVTPWRTTSYRVVAGGVTGTASRVLVAVRVGFHEPANGQLRGVIGPKRAGASVAIQKRRVDGTWKTLATVSTNADGEFAANVSLRAGTYRAVARLGGGYVAGYAYLRVT